MKDFFNERVKQLGLAQECVMKLSNNIDRVERSQLKMERDVFDLLNTTDKAINLSKEGKMLETKISTCFQLYLENPTEEEKKRIETLMNDMVSLFEKLIDAGQRCNDYTHAIEREIENRCELTSDIKKQVYGLSDSINSALACVEMAMAMAMDDNKV